MSRRLLTHDVLSDLFVGSWELYTRKQTNSRKAELSKDGASLTQGGISQTLVKSTFSQVISPPLVRNGNQSHGNHFGTTRVRKKCHYRMPSFPLLDHLIWATERSCENEDDLSLGSEALAIPASKHMSSEPWFQQVQGVLLRPPC